jgi:hypothetical protein
MIFAFPMAMPRNSRNSLGYRLQIKILHPIIGRCMTESSQDETAATISNANNPEKVAVVDRPGLVEGSHEELMYALGVNLARQLGDVRPLVQNGEELAHVAKGLLDAVVGRIADSGQRSLLARRGSELNQFITARA